MKALSWWLVASHSPVLELEDGPAVQGRLGGAGGLRLPPAVPGELGPLGRLVSGPEAQPADINVPDCESREEEQSRQEA